MGLKDSVDAVWTAAKARLATQVESEQEGAKFYEWGEFHARRVRKAIVVLRRVVEFEGEAVALVGGELSVVFGCMVQSGDKSKGKEETEALAFWLAEMFMADQFLGGVCRDTRVDSVELDFEAPEPISSREPEGEPQQWAAVTVVWQFEYSRV